LWKLRVRFRSQKRRDFGSGSSCMQEGTKMIWCGQAPLLGVAFRGFLCMGQVQSSEII